MQSADLKSKDLYFLFISESFSSKCYTYIHRLSCDLIFISFWFSVEPFLNSVEITYYVLIGMNYENEHHYAFEELVWDRPPPTPPWQVN